MKTRSGGEPQAEPDSKPERSLLNRRRRGQSAMEGENQEEGAEETMEHYVQSTPNAQRSAIVRPEVPSNFEIKPQILLMIQNNYQFGGLSHEDPNEHIEKFLEICDTFRFKDVTNEAEHDEQLYEAWERFKELLRKCPNHGIPLWMQIETFYNGITVSTRNLIDAAAGGTMNKKTPNEVYELIEEMSSNMYQYPMERSARGRVAGIQNVDPIVALQAQVESLTNQLSKLHKPSLVAQICDVCGGGHPSQECQAGRNQGTLPSNSETNPREQIKAITLRSGKVLEEQQHTQVEEDTTDQQQDKEREELNQEREVSKQQKQKGNASKNLSNDAINVDTLPYPARAKKDKLEDKFSKFIDIFKKLEINIPFVEALMKLNLGELKETNIMLQFADRSTKKPNGLIEDVLVRIGKFIYPCDFVVLDMEVDWGLSLILGRPFLATTAALIDVKQGKLTLRLNDEEIVFDIKQEVMMKDNLERCLVQSCTKEDDDPLMQQEVEQLEAEGNKEEDKGAEIKDPSQLEVKPLPSSFKYIFLEDNAKPVIISSCLNIREEKLLIEVVPKKGGITVIKNSDDELIPTRTVTGWRVCIDYRKLNSATRKDHFPLPFIDQMVERLAGNKFYCFLDGYSGYFQIPIAPEDQEKTTFTCPYGTFAYRRMPFGLCNAPATFQRCMIAICHDFIENFMEIFMDDFTLYGLTFETCLKNLDLVLARCEESNLVLNWEKCHFMVKEGIVLGHKISEKGIEVDRAKVEVIEKLPPPTNIKGIRSFLGQAGFSRRFIKDFSKIAKPLSNLLMKDVKFNFDDDCLHAFKLLKEKLILAPIVVAPIVVAPDWTIPFELMCDASDYAVGVVLGQRK
ncbi:hypothetical protein H6P81_010272 [Aristolochia fimbriata]|uniref:Reverse transcriptase domain-containing protein n=1 Tax=Aristolochia fimbriata TaxID=158543 RepID=A0AAV7ENB3_ARIFI|nr:hypothetical protein H6P81_010272 [Aristolochia fimbriata]